MPEAENKPVDVVSREEYNKVVEAHNSVKIEKERIERELNEKKNTLSEKQSWENEANEFKKHIEELNKKVDAAADVKVAKSVVTQPIVTEPTNQLKTLLDNQIPDRKVNPESYGSHIQRYGHYKAATTKQYSNEQLGMALSLHAGVLRNNPDMINNLARSTKEDIVVRQ